MNFLDVADMKGIDVAIVQVTQMDDRRGNAVYVYRWEWGSKVKKRVNKHVADHWDTYYKNIIPLPFVETVGVGQQAKVVKKNTREEMLEFLYSDE